MPHRLIDPATWFAEPGSAGVPFPTFAEAITHALAIPRADRPKLARIVTKPGSIYGWEAIEEMAKLMLR